MSQRGDEEFLGHVDLDIRILAAQSHPQNGVAEEEQPDEFVLHDIGVPQEGEVLHSLPTADEAIVTAHIRLEDAHEVSGRVGQMQVVLFLLSFLPDLHAFHLCDVDDCLQHNLVEEEGVEFEVVQIALLVPVDRNVVEDLDGLVDLLDLSAELSHVPVGDAHAWSSRDHCAKRPISDGAKLSHEVCILRVVFNRMEEDPDFLLGSSVDHDGALTVLLLLDGVESGVV